MAFSFTASGTYLINDLLDLAADRKHATKRLRSLASGRISIAEAVGVAVLLVGAGMAAAAWIGWIVLACFALYVAVTLTYSFWLKLIPILDVVTLAFLYTLRLIIGGAVGDIRLSPWLFQFSIFLFLSLAFVKRYSELRKLQEQGVARGYQNADLDMVSQSGIASGLLAALILAMYVNSPDVLAMYVRPWVLWWACPLMIYWILRIWLIARRGDMNEDPIVFASGYGVSFLVAGALGLLIVLGSLKFPLS